MNQFVSFIRKSALLAVLSLGLFEGVSNADTVTFSGLSGTNGDIFSTYTEGIFTVTSTSGTWVEGHLFGNPVPDIFSLSASSSVSVTSSSVNFTFSSVDLGNANTGVPTYQITGFLLGSPVLTASGALPGGVGFTTILSPNSSQQIDNLVISFNRGTTSSYNIDNISGFASTGVPETSSLQLLLAGLGGMAMAGWRMKLARQVPASRLN